ncbi:MAG: 50S ribosomal protein L10 [Actinobacteria bacterium RBG_16_64_13]|nr:MAG: 50S ribosomal protein L10 [Actinobacteria bacterium RBG_16_64_13]
MPRPDKIEAVKEITADLKATDVYYFVDYRGLTFSEATELRARLVKVDASLKVVKNTLAKIAAADAGVEGLTEMLQGPTAIVYCHGDPVKVAKTIQDFIKEKKKATLRGGKLQRSMLTASDVEKLATLPSREQLIAQLVGAIASPLTGLANVLSGPIRGLVVVLAQIQEQKASAA